MSQAQFQIPLITVISGQLITASLWNNEWDNVSTNLNPEGVGGYSDTDTQMQIQTAPYPGSVTSHATNLGGELERIRYQISAILGATTPAYWYAAVPISLTTLNNVAIPLGGIIDYHAPTISGNANFLQANGQAIGRSAYPGLFALYNALSPALPFGSGDGSTTFNLPNYNDVVSIGVNSIASTVGATGGGSTTLAANQIPTSSLGVSISDPGHNHTQNAHNHGITDPGHSHIEQYATPGGGGSAALIEGVNGAWTGAHVAGADVISTPTQSSTTGVSTQNTTPTNNSNTTGITASVTGGGSTPVPTMPPYLGMYKLVRVL